MIKIPPAMYKNISIRIKYNKNVWNKKIIYNKYETYKEI